MKNSPDRWCIFELIEDGTVLQRRIYSGSYGGYLGSESWYLSSNVVQVLSTDIPDVLLAVTQSGSQYHLHTRAYGMTQYMDEVYNKKYTIPFIRVMPESEAIDWLKGMNNASA